MSSSSALRRFPDRWDEKRVGNDLYVGPLTRSVHDEWESVAAQQARELGMRHVVVRPGGVQPAPEPDVRTAVEGWTRSLVDQGVIPDGWDETQTEWRPDRGWEELVAWAGEYATASASWDLGLPLVLDY
jgi:hypothetical protein